MTVLRRYTQCATLGASATALGLVSAATAAPLLSNVDFVTADAVYGALKNMCHQFPTRSLWIDGHPMGLCSRCVGGYLGVAAMAAGMLLAPERFKPLIERRFLIGASLMAPGVADGAIQLLTTYESTNLLRLLTGFAGGLGTLLLLLPAPLRALITKDPDRHASV